MKTEYMAIIVSVIIAGSIIFALSFEYSFEKEFYEINIQGMKEAYFVGDTYSFYYTLSGYGNTCGSLNISYPNKDGVIQHSGAVFDCTTIINRNLSYDSRQDGGVFTSLVPEIEGKHSVTVSLENSAHAIYEFTVLPKKIDVSISDDSSESKILECYALFHCDSTKQNFDGCINSKKNEVTIKSICESSNFTINDGCVNFTFSDGTKITRCY